MLDIGWQELLVIGVLALLVVGPKELPKLLRTVGQWAGKARSVAREFQRSMEDAAREADVAELHKLKDLKSDVEKFGKIDYAEQAKRSQSFLNGSGSAKEGGSGEPATSAQTAKESGDSAPAPAPSPRPEPEAKPDPERPASAAPPKS